MSFIALGLFALVGQSGKQIGRIPPEMEFEDDPPAVVRAIGFSPRLVLNYNGFTSYQVNVNGQQQNILGDAANEPSLCIDPTNPSRVAIGWRQFDSVTSNFRQSGYAYTADGGVTWTFPGKLENNVFRSDPVLQSRYDGTFLYLSLLETFFDDTWQSVNGGANWSRIAAADGGDKEWFTVDNTTSAGRGNLYQIWSTAGNNYGGRQFTRSTDGGLTWLNPVNIPNQPFWGTLDVDNAGTLYICGWSQTTNSFVVERSSNAKTATATPSFDLSKSLSLVGAIDYGGPVNPGGLTGQSWLAVDRSSTASPQPVYVLCSVNVNSTNPADVMIARSSDGGQTWGTPVRINDDPLNQTRYHWMAGFAVSPTGRVDAVWNDTRNDSSSQTSSLYYSYSLDGGSHFSSNIRLTSPFNQSVGYPNQNKMGDYLGVISNTQGVNIAYCATFNNEEDVYFLQFPSPVVVAPTSMQIKGGGPFQGTVGSLAAIDGNRLLMSGSFKYPSAAIHDVFLTGTSPSFSPRAILFNLVANTTFPGEIAKVSLFNWSTGSYEQVGAQTTLGTADSYLNVQASGDLNRFVQPVTGLMKADVHVAAAGGLHTDWLLRMDQAVWNVIP